MKSRTDSDWLESELRRALALRHPSPDFAWRTAMRALATAEGAPPGEESAPAAESTYFWLSRGWRAGLSLTAGLLITLLLGLSLRLHMPMPSSPKPNAAQARQVQAQVEYALQFTRVRLQRIMLRALPGLQAKVSSQGAKL